MIVANDEPVMRTMTKAQFDLEIARASSMILCDTKNINYWVGYDRGAKKAYHGERFGTAIQHAIYCEMKYYVDPQIQEIGNGYRDGLSGTPRKYL